MLYRIVLNDEVLGEEFEANSEAEKEESVDEIFRDELEYIVSDERGNGVIAVSRIDADEAQERMAVAAKIGYEKFAQENHLYFQTLDADKNVIRQEELDLAALLFEQYEYMMDSENGMISNLDYAASCVEKFLEEGSWHYAMMDGNKCITNPLEWGELICDEDYVAWEKDSRELDPIIWFGLEAIPDNFDDIWHIRRSDFFYDLEEKLRNQDCFGNTTMYEFMFYKDSWDIWPLIFDDYEYTYYSYWAQEAGIYPPSGNRLLEECPIDLNLDDTGKIIVERIDNFFLRKIKNFNIL